MCAGACKVASGCTEATGRAGAPFDNAPMPSTRKTHIDALAISLLLACCMFWGFQQVLVKATVAEVAPVFQAFVRFALATVAVAAWCLWRGVSLSGAGALQSKAFPVLAAIPGDYDKLVALTRFDGSDWNLPG